ncbi:MAG: helix-turn-helix transcriptional regulator [Rubrobacteraceae bacterium]|nr:helix-turn-helix transcriptional regulator [Rubrobacteraceae bacterium]
MPGSETGVPERSVRPSETGRAARLAALGQALSDPMRVKMLGMLAAGRGCCGLPDLGVPADGDGEGICVCEFEEHFGLGQSRVSYHLAKLKGAGLVREEKRGRWRFYSLEREAVKALLGELASHLDPGLGEERVHCRQDREQAEDFSDHRPSPDPIAG